MPQAEFTYNNTISGLKDVQENVKLKIEKANKKYKATTDKKRREKHFEKDNMMTIYLCREIIPAVRVPTKQLHPDKNSRTSSFEERGTDVGGDHPGACQNNLTYRQSLHLACRQGFPESQGLSVFSLSVNNTLQLSTTVLGNRVFEFA